MLLVPPSTGLYFSLYGVIYNPGTSINITDIGEQPSDRSDVDLHLFVSLLMSILSVVEVVIILMEEVLVAG